jgi:hypothetical protein
MAVWRIEVEAGDATDNVSAKQGFMMAVTDIKTYYLVSCLLILRRERPELPPDPSPREARAASRSFAERGQS